MRPHHSGFVAWTYSRDVGPNGNLAGWITGSAPRISWRSRQTPAVAVPVVSAVATMPPEPRRIPEVPPRANSDERLRQVAIQQLRCALVPIAGDRSMCRVAADRGVFCRGFRRWENSEFDRRWRRAIGRSTHLSREQMEQCADFWQLTEQLCQGVALACDEKPGPNSPCRGWDEFSDEDLARFCRELVRPPESTAITAGALAGQRGD